MPIEYSTIIANITGSDSLREGAKVVVIQLNPGSGHDRVRVRGLNRPGRRVAIWVNTADLRNIRFATVHPDDPMHGKAAECTATDMIAMRIWADSPKKRWRDLDAAGRVAHGERFAAEWSRMKPLPADDSPNALKD